MSKNFFAAVHTLVFLLALFCAQRAQAGELKPWSGGRTPALVLKDLQGAPHDLAQYRGKVVLVNFWATWCEPCRDEMPSMQRLQRRFEGKPFVVIAVNVGESEARIGEFLQKLPLDFLILRDHSSAAMKAWGVRGLPASFVVGRDGRIRYSHIGELNWDDEKLAATVERLLR
jgi:thiol-disulfide isomerase/thioredoxin